MAGGEGSRLNPLTAERSKPSVPFGGRYRIVDFALSNLINSGIYSIYLLVQYKSQELIEHVRKAWVLSPMLSGQFVTIVPPQMLGRDPGWFQGTADAGSRSTNRTWCWFSAPTTSTGWTSARWSNFTWSARPK